MTAPYPLFLRLEGRPVLVVGGGGIALEKATALRAAGAVVHVVAPEVRPELDALAERVERRAFLPADLDGKWLALAAAPPPVNRAVRSAADVRSTFLVAVDDVEACSAIGAAQLRRGGLTLAISSDGRAPALVSLLRQVLARLLPDEIEAWTELAEQARGTWKSLGVPLPRRKPLLLRALNELYEAGEGAS